ncbi:hypothetical protein GGR44_001154 [Sphingobium fontiphilum]|uniref:Lipoprotein n=1 Tax=Sphingobium fontiphilum TaxID=944425 RepID=A0A7W6DJ27_9SPHN|nr:hypothetical protein [Sphingobium fontiphilum]MBB3981507.1 hypothetical protein [Sphingobium fontiphilum]
MARADFAAGITALIGWLAAAPAMAQPPAEVTAAVERQLEDSEADDLDLGQARRLYSNVDLTGQEAGDWIVDFARMPAAMMCGTGGCTLQIYVAGPDGYRLAFDRQVLGYKIERGEGAPRLVTAEHGVHCGGTGSDECRYAYGWVAGADGRGWFLPADPGGPRHGYSGPLAQPLPGADRAITALAAMADAYIAQCKADGGAAETGEALALLPDLNDDGLPEALFDAARAMCARAGAAAAPCAEPACQSALLASGPEGWVVDWRGPPFDYAIRFDGGKAVMSVAAPDCGMCDARAVRLAEGRLSPD